MGSNADRSLYWLYLIDGELWPAVIIEEDMVPTAELLARPHDYNNEPILVLGRDSIHWVNFGAPSHLTNGGSRHIRDFDYDQAEAIATTSENEDLRRAYQLAFNFHELDYWREYLARMTVDHAMAVQEQMDVDRQLTMNEQVELDRQVAMKVLAEQLAAESTENTWFARQGKPRAKNTLKQQATNAASRQREAAGGKARKKKKAQKRLNNRNPDSQGLPQPPMGEYGVASRRSASSDIYIKEEENEEVSVNNCIGPFQPLPASFPGDIPRFVQLPSDAAIANVTANPAAVQKAAASKKRKEIMCKDLLEGYCKFGRRCRYSHDIHGRVAPTNITVKKENLNHLPAPPLPDAPPNLQITERVEDVSVENRLVLFQPSAATPLRDSELLESDIDEDTSASKQEVIPEHPALITSSVPTYSVQEDAELLRLRETVMPQATWTELAKSFNKNTLSSTSRTSDSLRKRYIDYIGALAAMQGAAAKIARENALAAMESLQNPKLQNQRARIPTPHDAANVHSESADDATTDNDTQSDQDMQDDNSQVTIVVGENHTPFRVPMHRVQGNRIFNEDRWDKDDEFEGPVIRGARWIKINELHFLPVYEWLQNGDYSPLLVNNRNESLTLEEQCAAEIVRCGRTLDLARILLLPDLIDVVAHRFDRLRRISRALGSKPFLQILTVVRLVYEMPSGGSYGETLMRDVLVLYVAENFWEICADHVTSLQQTLDRFPGFKIVVLERMAQATMERHGLTRVSAVEDWMEEIAP